MAQGIFTHKQVNQAIRQGAWSAFNPPQFVEYLAIAGGGAGGGGAAYSGGGGGAGGLLTGMFPITAGSSYTVTIGGGGTGSTGHGTNGTDTDFGPLRAFGGGGGTYGYTSTGYDGGSGGGTGSTYTPTVTGLNSSGVFGQGNGGGNNIYSGPVSGGYGGSGAGGGAGKAGLSSTSTSNGAPGGMGIASAISGTVVTYAGGGASGAVYAGGTFASTGGVGGGGSGAYYNGSTATVATAGQPNTGGGGGGASNGSTTAGSGGTGIVIVRYPGTTQFFTGGTLSYANGYVIHTFYAGGTLAPTTPTLYANPDYQIARSLRFNSADSATLTRTVSTTNRRTWTFSGWVKKSGADTFQYILVADASLDSWTAVRFQSEFFMLASATSGNYDCYTYSAAIHRDPSAWYHIVAVSDTTNVIGDDRFRIYVNGVRLAPSLYSTPSLNYETYINYSSFTQRLGGNVYNASPGSYFTGQMTELNFIDGQALTPSSFGWTNPATGVWAPVKYVGTYGTNGYYLKFADNSNTTAATLGADSSGNGNNWTPNNFSVSAGVGNDSLVDTPTSYGTDTGVGGEVRGNYCTWNPLVKPYGVNTYTNGNLDVVPNGNWNAVVGTIGITTGKWYWEITSAEQNVFIGIQPIGQNYATINPQDFNGVFVCDDNQKLIDGTRTAYTSTGHGAGVIVGVAVDLDAGSLTFYKNGVSQGAINFASSLTFGKTVLPTIIPYYAGYVMKANFGQRAFVYTAPTGYKAVCTQNLPTPTIGATSATLASEFFDTSIWAANGDNVNPRNITSNVDLANGGGLIWAKGRDVTVSHFLVDSVRGYTNYIATNSTAAESAYNFGIAGTTNGFTFTGSSGSFNQLPYTYVGWQWKAGGTAVTNTSGSITSQVSANPTSGFSIVTYTGTGANATIGHGLGAVPLVIITKNLTQAGNYFAVYTSMVGNTKTLWLTTNDSPVTSSQYWNNTTPTSSVFSVGSAGPMNGSTHSMLAYCFAPVAGYSAMGSYVGNGLANGPFVHTGFRPAFILIKGTHTCYWVIFDVARNTFNTMNLQLWPNGNDAENGTISVLDATSNGFKLRDIGAGYNDSATEYIYMAFASHPLKYSLAR